MHLSLREYNFEASTKYTLLSLIFFGLLVLFAFSFPPKILPLYELMLFAWTVFLVILTFDPLAWMPFAVTHTQFANGMAMALSVTVARSIIEEGFFVPNEILLILLGLWWASVLFHFITSESFIFSYLGGIERQMGMTFRLTIPVILFAGWQVFETVGSHAFFAIIISAGIVEMVILTLQFLDEEHRIKYDFSYLKSIGFRRYTGTISNPIPVANFLLTILPLTFAFYLDSPLFLFFVISYLAITWGLFLSHGRGSYIASIMVSILEVIYVVLTSKPIYMVIIALAVIILPPIFYLFTPQGKENWNRVKIVIDFVKRKIRRTTSQSAGQEQPESSAVNRAFIWNESRRAFRRRPWLGYGIENIARAMRSKFSRKSSAYFMTQVVDRSHNHYLDLLLEGGITHLLIYLALVAFSIYSSIVTGMPWIGIAIVGYSLDLIFSFPLQPNYLILMLILSVSAGLQFSAFHYLSYIFLGLFLVYLINLYFAHVNNVGMRYVQLAFSAENLGDAKVALDATLSALKVSPYEQRFFTVASNVLEGISSIGKLQFEDLHTFRVWFEASKEFILKHSEAPDVPFGTMSMVYAVVFSTTKDANYANESWNLAKMALKVNPFSLSAKRAIVTLLNTLGTLYNERKMYDVAKKDFKQSTAILRRIIDDFLNSPYANYELENNYWQAYFDMAKKSEDQEGLKKYFEIYKERFSGILFTYDIFTKISKVFSTPVGWTIINRDGTKIVYPVNTVMGPLVKRVWKFSHKMTDGRIEELYLTVGKDAKVTEMSLKPFIDEFMKYLDKYGRFADYWKDEGFIEN
ncbi:O-antigen ligase family protein [Athalassotoga sp.]|uniref:O-antigen ligase family protein n=1 Tax=Athalassotoga sp. TaxID=2022597 RepID=UPI003D02549F